MRMFLLQLFFMVQVPVTAFAMLRCPAPGPEYQEIISRLKSFSEEMVIDESCKNLRRDAEAMQNSMMSMGGFFGMGGGGTSQELSIMELSFLMRASSSVVASAKSIVDQLLVQPQCMKENGVSILQLLSSTTQQVTGLGAAFSGPYGIPVSFGGAAVAGILQGIDLLIQKHDYGYKFSKSEHRNLFVTNLCTYHDIRQEVVDMLYPQNRMTAYQTLVRELDQRKQELVSDYPLCARYQGVYDLQHQASPLILSVRNSFSRVDQEGEELSGWSLCLRLADLVHPDHAVLKDIIENLPEGNSGDYQRILSLYEFSKSNQGVLTTEECWEKNSISLLDANLRSKSIISEIIRGTEIYYERELETISREASGENPDRNLVRLLDVTLKKISWASDELKRLEKIAGDHSFQGRKELNSYKRTLDNRLFNRLAPKFMSWYQKESKESVARFKRHKKKNSRRIARKYFNLGMFEKASDPESLIKRAMEEKPDNKELHVRLYAMNERLLTDLSNAHLALGTIQDFSEYFARSGTISRDMIKLKESSGSEKLQKFMDSQESLVNTMIHYLDWCHEMGYIEADGIKTLIEKIRNCRLSKILDEKSIHMQETNKGLGIPF